MIWSRNKKITSSEEVNCLLLHSSNKKIHNLLWSVLMKFKKEDGDKLNHVALEQFRT